MPYYVAAAIVVSAVYEGKSAKKAAEVSARASMSAKELEEVRYQEAREDLAPWRETGVKALEEREALMGFDGADRSEELRKTPGYQFRLDEGLRALQRSSLAGSVTGNTYRVLVEYVQGIASKEYSRQFNRLSVMAGQGQAATGQTAQLGAASGARSGGYIQAAGDARAAGIVGRAGAYSSAVGTIAGMYGGGGMGGGGSSGGGGNMQSYYGGGRVAPGGSFGSSDPYAGAGGYGDNWTNY